MYMSSSNSFAANWLLFCLFTPFYNCAESDRIPYEINDPVYHQFQPIQPEPVLLEEQFLSNVPKSQYDVYYSKHSLVQPRIPFQNSYSEASIKQNVPRLTPQYQLGEVYKPYYYSQFVRNQETPKKESTEQLEREEIQEIDEEIMKKMNLLDKILSEDADKNDIEMKNTVEDEIIAEMNISEETKRVVRQVRRHRPGFFWTLARLAFETFNDTRSAVKQISNLINQNIAPDPTTRRPANSHSLIVANMTKTIPSIDQNNTSNEVNATMTMAEVNATTTMATPATQAPFRLTPINLQNLIRRNLRGLIRLFNIEWQDALNQSDISVKEFQKDLGNQIGSYLRDNPKAF